jgi:HAD superfamily hydrolase (TIGR01549 family)
MVNKGGLQKKSGQRYIDRYDVLLLDMGETFMFDVDRFDHNADLIGTYKRLGGNLLSDKELNEILFALFNRFVEDSHKEELYENFPSLAEYLKMFSLSASLPAKELLLLEDVFSQHEIGTIPNEYSDTIEKLHQTHQLGIISDIWAKSDIFYRRLEEAGIRDLFKVIVFSSDIGIIKPSPKIFSAAMEKLNADISKVVYIGDSLRRDIVGAGNFGMSSIWIGDESLIEIDESVRPDHIVSDLRDLL